MQRVLVCKFYREMVVITGSACARWRSMEAQDRRQENVVVLVHAKFGCEIRGM
jgi:hypothetical protein